MCYGFEVDLLRVDLGLFSNWRFFCRFLSNCTTPFSGCQPGGAELGGGRTGEGPHLQTQPPRPPFPGPSSTQAPGVCGCVCVCACRVRVQGARKGREVCVCVCPRGLLPACVCVSRRATRAVYLSVYEVVAPAAWALAEPAPGLPEGRGASKVPVRSLRGRQEGVLGRGAGRACPEVILAAAV